MSAHRALALSLASLWFPAAEPVLALGPPLHPAPQEARPPGEAATLELPEPGRLPDDVSEAARARYGKLLGALGGRPALRSFTLRFDVETRSEAGTQEARRTELSYLDEGPGWVFGATLNQDGSVKQSQMRGPQDDGRRGYWQVLKSGDVQRLVGPDFAEARAQLDGWAALCHDLLLLQQPDRLRVVRLVAREAATVGSTAGGPAAGVDARALDLGGGEVLVLPDALLDPNDRGRSRTPLAARARQLEWFEIVTPDIRLWREEVEPGALRRVLLGVHPDVGVPELAILTQNLDGRFVAPDATLLHLSDWRPYSGAPKDAPARLLPRSTRLFELRNAEGDERRYGPLVFRDRATVDLFLLEGGQLGGEPLPASRFKPRSR